MSDRTRVQRRQGIEHGVLLAYGVGLALHVAHAPDWDRTMLPPLGDWLRDATLALPVALLAASLGTVATSGVRRWASLPAHNAGAGHGVGAALASALPPALLYAALVVPGTFVHAALSASAAATPAPAAADALANAALALLVGLALLLPRCAARGAHPAPARVRVRRTVAALLTAPLATGALLAPPATAADPATDQSARCDASTQDRVYRVAAINAHIPHNRWGSVNPNGMIYVLQHDKAAVRDWHKPLGSTESNRRLRPRPLVLRANEGECVAVQFRNELDAQQSQGIPASPRASMHVRGIPFDVQSSGGGHVGYNDDSTIAIGDSTTYYWQATTEGSYFFHDTATSAGGEGDGGSLSQGLYGTFVVEPAGSVWTDPVSGDPLYTGTRDQSGELYLNAIIDPPGAPAFRETVQLAQDELPHAVGFAFNYGAENANLRQQYRCPDCVGEETSLSSWTYGDPALVKLASGEGPWLPHTPAGKENCGLGTPGFTTDSCFTANVVHAYVGDPTKFRYGMAGVKETHVFHMHAHQWLAEPDDVGDAGAGPTRPGPNAQPESNTIDSQTFGPMEMFTADLLFGAGSKNGTVGDAIFHCHLYPHFVEGFWGLFRVHDVREDGTGELPDGTIVANLRPLPDRNGPPQPTADNPGYPRFIPGEFGWRAPQAPLSVTDPDGQPADRYVAGRRLDPQSAPVRAERAVMQRLSGGQPKPGAPFADPCPPGARQVTYHVSAIQTPLVYNERGDFDAQGRILVLDRDVDAILSGRKKPEPLFVRLNAGDCITWKLTNRIPNWYGNDAFVRLQQTNMLGQHVHLVKFDVLASDGASNGWNYQQAAFTAAQADFNAQMAANPGSCTATDCRLDLPADYDPGTTSADIPPGQTITERWYADYELRTAFTHDHHFAAVQQNRGLYAAVVIEPAGTDFRHPVTGAWFQPVNDPAHGAVCGRSCAGAATGTSMDVIGPGTDDDFREFGLAIADFVSLTRGGGNPRDPADAVNPPPEPEAYPSDDPGVMAVNYANAPLRLRTHNNGRAVDPAYRFSSHVFGDPMTPVLQTYAGDNVRIRLIQGAHEEQHILQVHGMRWRKEPADPQSHYVDTAPVGVSEAFTFEVPRLGCESARDCRGDYLYSSASADDLAMGMWGLLRVHGGTVPRLLPLPDNPQQATGSVPSPSATALAPPRRLGPGDPCPPGAPTRSFDVVALQTDIAYNDGGDHDPFGLVYALAGDEAAIRNGKNPEPLVLRAHEGDCLEVRLTNKLTPAWQDHRGEGDAKLPDRPADATRPPGLRVSMHPGLLEYDVRGSDGAAVGYNRDQTVAPGGTIRYRWYASPVAPGELGAVNLTDYGDVLGHRHHGLYAALIVEPRGSSWHDPVTGRPLASGAIADIRRRGAPDFREATVLLADGLNLRTADGALIEDPTGHPPEEPADPNEPAHPEALDAEDSGEKGFNYRSEPFRHRLGYEPATSDSGSSAQLAGVYDSHTHGDPATPILRAYTGDRVRMRVLQGADKPRQHAFGVSGHSFAVSPHDPHSRTVGTISGLGVGSAVNAHLGRVGGPGDYLYGCALGFFHRSAGEWGLLRVYPRPRPGAALRPTALGAVDDPRAGGHPVQVLEPPARIRARVFDDKDRDGRRDRGERRLRGVRVAAVRDGRVAAADATNRRGVAVLRVRPGRGYRLRVHPPPRMRVHAAPGWVRAGGPGSVRTVSIRLRTRPAALAVRVFLDRDRDGRRDRADRWLRGVRVVAVHRPVRRVDATNRRGVARLRLPARLGYRLHIRPGRRFAVGDAPRWVRTGAPGSVRRLRVAVIRR